jgi:hypothetical protein
MDNILGEYLAIFVQYLVPKFNICDINTLTPFQLQLRDGLRQQAPQQHQGDPHLYLNNCTINQHVPPDHHTLQFANGSMHLQDILHNWSHDVDDTRYYLLTTLHDLLLSMKDKNTLQLYVPTAKKPTYQRSPQTLKNAIIITSKKLMTLILQADRAHHSDDCSKIHTLADDYFNLVLEVGKFQDMKDILHKTLEYRLHWPNLKQQRQELCKHLPTWRYQLESITIFPLLYTIGWHNNTDS